jgi:hypothetical protein
MAKGSRRSAGTRRGWQQWSEAEARAALKELAESGLSDASFARGRGFSTQRLRYWKRRLAGAEEVSFVAVPLPKSALTPAMIEIACDDVVVRVREELDVGYVARLAMAIGAARARRC